MRKDPGPDRHRSEFLAALLFAEAVSPDRVRALIDERIGQHGKKIEELSGLLEEDVTPVSRFVIEYGIAMQRAALDYLKGHRDQLLGELGNTIEAAE